MIIQTNDLPIVSRIHALERLLLSANEPDLGRAEALALDIARSASMTRLADLALRISASAGLMKLFPDHREYAATLERALRSLQAAIH